MHFNYLTGMPLVGILTLGLTPLLAVAPAYSQDFEIKYDTIQGVYENKELGLSLRLPESMTGFVYQYEHGGEKGLTIQIHPESDPLVPCCPAIETSSVVFQLHSDTLDYMSSPDLMSGDIYATFQGYNATLSVETLGGNQVLASTGSSNNDREGLDYVRHLGKSYLMTNGERFLKFGLWATEEKYQEYLDEFEESAKSLSLENVQPVDLHSLFSPYVFREIELELAEGIISPEIITPSVVDSLDIDEESKMLSINVTEPNGNSFVILNSGDVLAGPHTVLVDGEPAESTLLSNGKDEYLFVFYEQPGNHQITITGMAIVPEFGAFAALLAASGIVGVIAMTKYLQNHSRKDYS